MGKFKSHEEAVKAFEEQKAKLKAAREKRDAFEKANKLRKGQIPDDKKLAKEYTALAGTVKTEKAALETIEAEEKALRPAKEKTTKYVYPPEVVSEADKKKFRAAQRRKLKEGDADEKKTEKKGKGDKEEKVEKKVAEKKDAKKAPEAAAKKVVIKKKSASKED